MAGHLHLCCPSDGLVSGPHLQTRLAGGHAQGSLGFIEGIRKKKFEFLRKKSRVTSNLETILNIISLKAQERSGAKAAAALKVPVSVNEALVADVNTTKSPVSTHTYTHTMTEEFSSLFFPSLVTCSITTVSPHPEGQRRRCGSSHS